MIEAQLPGKNEDDLTVQGWIDSSFTVRKQELYGSRKSKKEPFFQLADRDSTILKHANRR